MGNAVLGLGDEESECGSPLRVGWHSPESTEGDTFGRLGRVFERALLTVAVTYPSMFYAGIGADGLQVGRES
jgi:hypothetical protein